MKYNTSEAFTGLEAAIVLIAFVVVAAVFAYVVSAPGSSQPRKPRRQFIKVLSSRQQPPVDRQCLRFIKQHNCRN